MANYNYIISQVNSNACALTGCTMTGGLIGTTGVFSSTLQAAGVTNTGNATIAGTLGVTGNATFGGTLGVTGALTGTTGVFSGALQAAGVTNTGNSTVAGTLGVTGNATFGGTLGVTGALTGSIVGASTEVYSPAIYVGSSPGTFYLSPNGGQPLLNFATNDYIIEGSNQISVVANGTTSSVFSNGGLQTLALIATSGTFSSGISATTGSFSGNVSAVNGTFTSNLTANNAVYVGTGGGYYLYANSGNSLIELASNDYIYHNVAGASLNFVVGGTTDYITSAGLYANTLNSSGATNVTGNLSVGGGSTFSGNISVPSVSGTGVASTTQAAIGTATNLILSPASLGGSNVSGANPGYIKYPGGLIIQFGNGSTGSSFYNTFSFATAFPTAVISVVANASVYGSNGYTCQASTLSTSTFNVGCQQVVSPAGSGLAAPFSWIAIGY